LTQHDHVAGIKACDLGLCDGRDLPLECCRQELVLLADQIVTFDLLMSSVSNPCVSIGRRLWAHAFVPDLSIIQAQVVEEAG
jgi:hypothetical protein